jgi:hypothetical protein
MIKPIFVLVGIGSPSRKYSLNLLHRENQNQENSIPATAKKLGVLSYS